MRSRVDPARYVLGNIPLMIGTADGCMTADRLSLVLAYRCC